MKELGEKVLWLAAGAAVGAACYLAWRNRERLMPLVEQAVAQAREMTRPRQDEGETSGEVRQS
jgi:hypothetical protein